MPSRTSLTARARLASETNTSCQTRSSSSALATARGRHSTSSFSSSKAFGDRWTSRPPRYGLSGVLEGPASVAPGTTAQFHFTLKYNDGSTEDASAKAAWRSGNPQVVDVRAGGAVRAVSRGRADVFASFSVSANTTVFVLEDGTYA